MIKKMIAAMSAAAIMCSCAAYSSGAYSIPDAFAAEQSPEQSETCGVMVSVVAPNYTLPDGITAKIVEVRGEERTVLEEWDPKTVSVKEIKGLEYSDDVSYKLTTEGLPEGYCLPAETDIVLKEKGYTDKIVLCGYAITDYPGFLIRYDTGKELHFNISYVLSKSSYSTITDARDTDIIKDYSIVDDNGFRYLNSLPDKSDELFSTYTEDEFIVPDGHYTAKVELADGYRFLKKYSDSARTINKQKNIPLDYFSSDLSEGISFNVEHGYPDKALDFFIESEPTEENSCSADISVVDAETGEPINGCTVELDVHFPPLFGKMRWITADDKPMKLDALYNLNETYNFRIINSPMCYESSGETSFRFEAYGEHADAVIKLKRIMTDEEAAAIEQVVLPDEDPVPTDSEHCAVTVGVFDQRTKGTVMPTTVHLVEYIDGDRANQQELASWEASEEPVKTITDIEYHEGSEYYITFNNDDLFSGNYVNEGRKILYFRKGGDTDKIAVPMYNQGNADNLDASCIYYESTTGHDVSYSIDSFNSNEDILESSGVYDDKGYRYSFTQRVFTDNIGAGNLPDGEYTLKCVPAENYRFIPNSSQCLAIRMISKKYPIDYIANNAANGENGFRFKVENGITDGPIHLMIEAKPTAETASSASISVVDAKTGETVKGITGELIGGSIDTNDLLKWNTSDTPVMTFDNLIYINKQYGITLYDVPDEYKKPYTEAFSFNGYGEHKDIVIELEPAYTMGDINDDGAVDSVDASAVLSYYAKISTDKEGGFDDRQRKAADVDRNSVIDAIDASNILAYYAYLSTVKEEPMNMETYMTSN